MGTLRVDEIKSTTAHEDANAITLSANSATLTSNVNFPAGHVLQVVQTVKSDTQSATASGSVNWTDITGFTQSITPSSASNKILINISITYGSSVYAGFFKILAITAGGSYSDLDGAIGTASSNRSRITMGALGGTADPYEISTATMMYLDSPSTTSQRSYKVQFTSRHSGTMTINTGHSAGDADYTGRGISTITCMEIAG
jgi:hypothetical protein